MSKINRFIRTDGPENYMRRLTQLRMHEGLKQTQIAEKLGTSQTQYARYETGSTALPIRHLVSLCTFYDVSSDYVLGLNPGRFFIPSAHLDMDRDLSGAQSGFFETAADLAAPRTNLRHI